MRKWIAVLLALMLALPGAAALAERKEVKSIKPDSGSSAEAGISPAPQVSFTIGGVTYTLGELEDEPRHPLENRFDNLPGHVITFNYSGNGYDQEEANMALYRGARLITPDGQGGSVFSNWGNTENPYLLYFGLSAGVNLKDCTLVVDADGGEVRIPLGETAQEPAQATDEPEPTDAPAPEPEPAESSSDDGWHDAFAIYYRGDKIEGGLGYVSYDQDRKLMGVSFYCPDLSDHIVIETADGNMTITVPVLAKISVGGRVLSAVDGTFYQTEALWFFDTDQQPDTVTFYPHGSEDDPSSYVTVDARTGSILSRGVEPTASERGNTVPATEPESEDEPEDEPEPEPQYASPDSSELRDLLAALGDETSDPWQKAIYQSVGELSLEGGVYTFTLRSFNPNLSELGRYEDDRDEWLRGFFDHVTNSSFEATLTMGPNGPDPDSLSALKKAVAREASGAKAEFDKKAVRVALADYLLPKPAGSIKDAAEYMTLDQRYKDLVDSVLHGVYHEAGFAPLFWAQSSQTLNVSGGPHALVLSAKGADASALIAAGVENTMDSMKQRFRANMLEDWEIREAFIAQLLKVADGIRQKGGVTNAFAFDIDQLSADSDAGQDFADYLAAYTFDEALDQLISDVLDLPDAQPQSFPKSGRISGSKSGTKVIIKAPDDGDGRYVQMRTVDGDEMKVDMFIRPGGSATVYVSKGMYYLLVATGKDWYGVDGLFGSSGYYSETTATEIKGSSYYHTITLRVEKDGNMSSSGTSMGAFAK